MKFLQTAERVSPQELSDNYVFQRSVLAYKKTANIIFGDVLEIGTGSGYGIELIAPRTHRFVTIDKCSNEVIYEKALQSDERVSFLQMTVPPLRNIPDNSFDFVVSFQVIEHIEQDEHFVEEVYRVLKNGGKFILTTPNKKTSLTRNPWHVREYTHDELASLLLLQFQSIEKRGVFGNRKVMRYYAENKKSVQRITRFDIFNLQYVLPRQWLQIPYDILNRMNRKKLLHNTHILLSEINMDDFSIKEVSDDCLDLFYLAEKNIMANNE